MNHEHDACDDARHGSGHDPEQRRLTEIERTLRAARPCPPQLDLAAIERAARETESPDSAEWAHYVVRKQDPGAAPRGRRARFLGAVSASWICGALVGALVVSQYYSPWGSRGASTEMPAPSIAHDRDHQMPDVARTADGTHSKPGPDGPLVADRPTGQPGQIRSSSRSQSQFSNVEWLASADLLDLDTRGGDRIGPLSSTLRVGMCLPNSWPADRREPPVSDAAPARPATDSGPVGNGRDQPPLTPEVTRQRLLQELTNGAAGTLL